VIDLTAKELANTESAKMNWPIPEFAAIESMEIRFLVWQYLAKLFTFRFFAKFGLELST
jgi:hypothetical protein